MIVTNKPVRVHQLKSWPESFNRILSDEKPFDLRKADRDYRVGDWVMLHLYDPVLKTFVGDKCYRRIGCIEGPFTLVEEAHHHRMVILGYQSGHPGIDLEFVGEGP